MKIRYVFFALALGISAVHAQGLSQKFPVKGGTTAPNGMAKPKRKKLPPQSQFALKTAFPTVKGFKGIMLASDLTAAKAAVGKQTVVFGTVDKVFVGGGNSIVLLNFAKDYKAAVVAAVKAKDFGKFPLLSSLKGKKVTVSGKMIMYKGRPEVEVTQAGAIKVVK